MVRPIKSALLSQLTQPERACFHPHRPSSECLIRFQGCCCGPCTQARCLPSQAELPDLPAVAIHTELCYAPEEPAACVCLARCFPKLANRSFQTICTHPGRFSPSASFLICRPSFAVQQLLASAVWAGACRSYLARQLGVIQPGTPTRQCHVLAPLIAQFCPDQKYSEYLRIILQIHKIPNDSQASWVQQLLNIDRTQKNQSSDSHVPSCTHLSASHAHICDPHRSLCTDISAAHGGTSSDHHKEHIASANGHGNLGSKGRTEAPLISSCRIMSSCFRKISDIPDRDTMGVKRLAHSDQSQLYTTSYKYKWKWYLYEHVNKSTLRQLVSFAKGSIQGV